MDEREREREREREGGRDTVQDIISCQKDINKLN